MLCIGGEVTGIRISFMLLKSSLERTAGSPDIFPATPGILVLIIYDGLNYEFSREDHDENIGIVRTGLVPELWKPHELFIYVQIKKRVPLL